MIETFTHFLKVGFEHVLPDGLDHVLFVLGLFLICRDFFSVLWQVTLFTIGHSLTLGLALCGLVNVPHEPVEVLIALSITFIAVENIYFKTFTNWRPWVILGCGLIHGLGFAGAFLEVGIPPNEALVAILSLSLGVEMGQIAVISLAFLCFGTFWNRTWYRKAVTVPGSLIIAAVGLFWAVTRMTA